MSDATQLLPCPFCGKAAPMHTPHGQTWVIQCVGHARIEEHGYDEAVAAWNTRAPDAERDALRAELAEARAKISKATKMLVRAYDRIHCLPRTSDTKLAEEISVTLAALAKEQPR